MAKAILCPLKQIASVAALVAAATISSAAPSHAFVITLQSEKYNISFVTNSIENLSQPFFDNQPWANNLTLAAEAAAKVSGQLGYPNEYLGYRFGPVFISKATYPPSISDIWEAAVWGPQGIAPNSLPSGIALPTGVTYNAGVFTYSGPLDSQDFSIQAAIAQADKVSTAVPAPLPVLGAAAAFGYSRKLRKRIKDSKQPAVTV